MKILVVDDLRDNRALLQALLQSQGHEVLVASNGLEALDLARTSPPGLVISDVLMPEMDGFTLCRVMKGMKEFTRIPFVFYTATYTEPADDRLGLAIGASAYIHKPLEPEAFLDRIDRIVEASRHHELPVVGTVEGSRDEIDALHHARVTNKLSEKIRSESRLLSEHRTVLESVADGIVVVNADGEQTLVNRAAARMLGYEPGELIGRRAHALWHHSRADGSPLAEEACAIHIAMETRHQQRQVQEVFWRKDGTSVPVEYSVSPLIGQESAEVTGAVVVFRDIEARLRAEQRQRLTQRVFDSTTEGIVITDAEANIIEINQAFSDITGYARETVLGQNPSILKSGRHEESFYRDMWHTLNTSDVWHGEIWNRRKNGEIYPQLATINAIRDEDGVVDRYVGVFRDVSDAMRSQRRMDHLLHYDALTDLPNRTLLYDRIEQALARTSREGGTAAVVLMDLDHFKDVNESLGHAIGDRLLQQVAERLPARIRSADTVARLGGDEFVILLTDVEQKKLPTVLSRDLIGLFERPFEIPDQPSIPVSASIGVALYPQDGDDAATLLANADAAMYRAKKEGRNNFRLYSQELTQQAMDRVVLAGELRKALDQQQLFLEYQPQIDLTSGRMIGIEALARWRHPERGPISPAQFIPVAEDSGLIHPLGEWVLRSACRQGAEWLAQDVDFGRISVNIAGPQIERGNLPKLVAAIIAETGLPSDRLELEVTEGFIMRRAEAAIEQMDRIRRLGVTLSIDDFGTGYSSLSYLKRLPIQKLKIDQSFVRDIPDDRDDQAIASAVIALGKSLDLRVIAEGVETEAQARFLKEQGCQEAQGYLYSRPMGLEEVAGFVRGLGA